MAMDQRINHVNKIAQVVQRPPQTLGMVVDLPEHGASYHKDDVV